MLWRTICTYPESMFTLLGTHTGYHIMGVGGVMSLETKIFRYSKLTTRIFTSVLFLFAAGPEVLPHVNRRLLHGLPRGPGRDERVVPPTPRPEDLLAHPPHPRQPQGQCSGPDPPDPHVFGPPGSGSISQRCGSGFFHYPYIIKQSSKKNLDSYCFSFGLLIFEKLCTFKM